MKGAAGPSPGEVASGTSKPLMHRLHWIEPRSPATKRRAGIEIPARRIIRVAPAIGWQEPRVSAQYQRLCNAAARAVRLASEDASLSEVTVPLLILPSPGPFTGRSLVGRSRASQGKVKSGQNLCRYQRPLRERLNFLFCRDLQAAQPPSAKVRPLCCHYLKIAQPRCGRANE